MSIERQETPLESGSSVGYSAAEDDGEHDKFGKPIGGSRWFNQEPEVRRTEVKTFREEWMCPCDGCPGEMTFNGMSWPTGGPRYHHTCHVCGFTAAVHANYPRVVTKPADAEEK